MIQFQNVSKSYGEKTVLHNLNLEIGEGEFFVLAGTSGSGKTTTLKMVNRLVEPTRGEIFLGGEDIRNIDLRELRLNTGYVLQSGAIFPNLTVYENIEIIPEMKKWTEEKRKQVIEEYLNLVGMDPVLYRDRYPSELSGGEQQRVGILRAIVARPNILLLDEPFSALDPIFRFQLQDLILDLHNQLKITTLFVTHDMNEALKLGDRICVLSKGAAVQIDTPEQIKENPANEFVAEFFEKGIIYE